MSLDSIPPLLLASYRRPDFCRQLGLISFFWALNCVVGWLYFCQIGYACPLTRLAVTFFAGLLFWSVVTPLANTKINALKVRFHDPGQRLVVAIMLSLAIIGLNQLVVNKAVELAYEIFYGYRETSASWISSIISNNIILNFLFYGLLIASAWVDQRWKSAHAETAGTAPAADEDSTRSTTEQCHYSHIQVKEGSVVYNIEQSCIRLVQADQNCVHIHTSHRKFTIYSSLVRFNRQLDPALFVRVHRSAIVNVGQIQVVRNLTSGDAELVLNDGSVVKCSRNYKKSISLRAV